MRYSGRNAGGGEITIRMLIGAAINKYFRRHRRAKSYSGSSYIGLRVDADIYHLKSIKLYIDN